MEYGFRLIATLVATPHIPVMNKILNMVEPIIVPRPISPSSRNTDVTDINIVGIELPAAMKVAPATSGWMSSLENERVTVVSACVTVV
jgi:hypothetical protein